MLMDLILYLIKLIKIKNYFIFIDPSYEIKDDFEKNRRDTK